MKTLTDEQRIIEAVYYFKGECPKSMVDENPVILQSISDDSGEYVGVMCSGGTAYYKEMFEQVCTFDEFEKYAEEMSEAKWLHPLGLAQNAVQHNITEDILSRSRRFK